MKNKERILEGARDLFFANGIRSVTMDDVAKHLGMSKKTLYEEFSDKDKIVKSLLELFLSQHERDFKKLSMDSPDAVFEITSIMKHMSEMFGAINPTLFYDMQKYHPASWKIFMNFKAECILGMITDNMLKGVKQGLYRKEIKINILALLRAQEIELALNPIIYPHNKFNISEVQLCLLDHFLHGILSPKGKDLLVKYLNVKSN